MKSKIIKKQVAEYVAVFETDQKVGGYSVTIPALPGCISEGDTFEEALANIKEAAQLYTQKVLKEAHQTRQIYASGKRRPVSSGEQLFNELAS